MVVGTGLVASFDRFYLINDACQYESTARNIRDGLGARTSCLFYGEHHYSGEMPAPQTVFPPGYPGLMAMVSKATGLELHVAAFAINLTAFLLSGLVLYSLCIQLGCRVLGAVLVVIAWLSTAIVWHCVWWGLTEPPFMLLTLLSFRCVASVGWRGALLGGIVAAMAISIRYAGMFLVAAAAVSYLVVLLTDKANRRGRLVEAILFGAPPTLTTWFLFSRNADLVSTPLGGNDYELGQSIKRIAVRFLSSITELIGIPRQTLLGGSVAEYSFVAVTAIVVFTLVKFLGNRDRAKKTAPFFDSPVRMLCLLFPPVYAAAVVATEYLQGSGMNDRLLMPAVPILLAISVAVADRCNASGRLIRTGCLVAIAAVTLTQFSAHQMLAMASPPAPQIKLVLQGKLPTDETVEHFLTEHTSFDEPLLVNQPQLVHGVVKCPVVGLATGRYNTGEPWDTARVHREVVKRFNVRYVLSLRGARIKDSSTSLFFMDLARGFVPPYLREVFQNEDLVLYEVVEPVRSFSN